MAFKVVSTPEAESDVREVIAYISKQSTVATAKWLMGFEDVLENLNEFPLRFMPFLEEESSDNLYRSCLYYSHRIIYRVDEANKVVYIVRVYHVARTPLRLSDFD